MPLYEHVFLARQDISQQQVEALTESMKSIIEEGGGSVSKVEYWGLKSLTYKIKKNRKAHYSLLNIDSPHPAVAEMERQMGLNDDVIRLLTLKVDELEEAPSIMMRNKGGRDDRRGRRDDRRPRRDDDRPAPPPSDAAEEKPADTKTADAKPADAKPAEAKPAEPVPAEPAEKAGGEE